MIHAEAAGLILEVGLVDGAEKKDGEIAGVAVLEDLAGAGEKGNGMVQFPKDFAEDFLELVEGGVRNVLFIKTLVGEVEFFPEGLAVEGRLPMGGEDAVGSRKDGGEVVHEGAGPVEDEVADQDKGFRG
jgi:hypothetical protein